ncbi:MAG TPA: glycosyltransferase family 39 protein [Gaiellaceae bacterium]
MSRGRLDRFGAAAALGALVALSAGLRFAAARGIPTPWIAPDEMFYALLGRSLWEHGSLNVLGGPTPFYSLVYPALAGLPLSLGSVHAGYTALKAVQAVAMSLTAVPVYLWGRSLMRPGWALAAAALTLAIPGLGYSGLVMTEVAFYPLLVVTAWATARALAEPTPRRQALLLAASALLVATRLQALVLVAAVPTAAGIEALLAREPRRVLRLWPLGVAAAGGAVFLLVRRSAGLGGYAAAAGSYGPGDAVKFVLYHAAALLLLCGVVPLCAVVLQLVAAARRTEAPPVRAYLAVAVSFSAWIVVEVGVFASEHALRIEERDLLGLAPLLFLGFALWLDRGAPRTYAVAAAVALAAAAVLLSLPYHRYVNAAAVPDSFTFAAVWRWLSGHRSADPALLVGVPAVGLAAAFALLPRKLLPALVPLLAAALVAASVAASAQVRQTSANIRDARLGADPRWIDRAATGPTGIVFPGGNWTPVWASLFWNRRLVHVYDVPGAEVLGPVPQQELSPGPGGAIAVSTPFLAVPSAVIPDGEQIAITTEPGSQQGTLTLWRLSRPARLLLQTAGFQPNGDVYSRAFVRAYDCSGSFELTLLGKTTEHVEIRLGGEVVRQVALEAGQSAQVVVPVARPGTTCLLAIVPDNVLGVTQVGFAR